MVRGPRPRPPATLCLWPPTAVQPAGHSRCGNAGSARRSSRTLIVLPRLARGRGRGRLATANLCAPAPHAGHGPLFYPCPGEMHAVDGASQTPARKRGAEGCLCAPVFLRSSSSSPAPLVPMTPAAPAPRLTEPTDPIACPRSPCRCQRETCALSCPPARRRRCGSSSTAARSSTRRGGPRSPRLRGTSRRSSPTSRRRRAGVGGCGRSVCGEACPGRAASLADVSVRPPPGRPGHAGPRSPGATESSRAPRAGARRTRTPARPPPAAAPRPARG
jgi:hypothetical protein